VLALRQARWATAESPRWRELLGWRPSTAVEGAQHPDRNAQVEHINAKAESCITREISVISVDTKKELVGNVKSAGSEWQPQGEPELVDVHDFPSDAVGKAIPYRVYDRAANDGS